jgi:hypothetical protein
MEEEIDCSILAVTQCVTGAAATHQYFYGGLLDVTTGKL